MHEIERYTEALGVTSPWKVSAADADVAERIVEVRVRYEGPDACPECGAPAGKYDTRSRRWQHTDVAEYQLFVTADIPRVECPAHGIQHISAEWSGLTWYPL